MEVARSCGNREERDMFCANCGTRLEDEYRYAGTDSVSTRIVSIDMGGPEQNGLVSSLVG